MRAVQIISESATSAKTALGVAVGTIGVGEAYNLAWIPEDIGKLASLIGILLTVTLTAIHILKYLAQSKKEREEHNKRMILLDKQIETAGEN